jgi:GR25 family glycosyltransferase involved in LPS biosynthesis
MKIFLTHKKGLKDRLNNILILLTQCNFVEDIEIITNENSSVVFSSENERSSILLSDFPNKNLTDREKSIFHKQYKILEKISNQSEPGLVFEDDVFFDPLVLDNFISNLKNAPLNWDFIFFGTGCNLSIEGQNFVKCTKKLKSKCADSMLITPIAASNILKDIKENKAHFAYDWDLNYRFIKLNMNIYWYEPGITFQGSQNNIYKSEIQI